MGIVCLMTQYIKFFKLLQQEKRDRQLNSEKYNNGKYEEEKSGDENWKAKK